MISKGVLLLVAAEQRSELESHAGDIVRESLADVAKYNGRSAVIVKGIRRCGKSTLVKQAMQRAYGGDFHYFNFDDERIHEFDATDFQRLMEALYEPSGKRKALFFDEIQNVRGWELFVNRLLRGGNAVFITGSNANLLSSELGTHLTGRHADFDLYPFSFREFLSAKGDKPAAQPTTVQNSKLSLRLREYLQIGGMPEAVLHGDYRMLVQVVEDIIQKDIIRRHDVRKPSELRSVLRFFISNTGNPITFRSVSENFAIKSASTIGKYFSYAEEACLLFMVRKFERKIKLIDKSPRKVYCIDTGLAARNSLALSENKGALLETAVAVELKRRGVAFRYYLNSNGSETDFVTLKDADGAREPEELIQVCLDPSAQSTMKREEDALLRTMKETRKSKGTIITLDFEASKTIEGKRIEYVPAWKWFLA